MTVQFALREDAEHFAREEERLTSQIEELERKIVTARQERDVARFHRAEASAAANFLDNAGFRVDRDDAGVVTVRVGVPPPVIDTETRHLRDQETRR